MHDVFRCVMFRTSRFKVVGAHSIHEQGVESEMSITLEQDPTRYFSVVGAAYVPERHAGSHNPFEAAPAVRPSQIDLRVSYLVLLALLAGISVFAGEISLLPSFGLTTDVLAAVIE
jgi:hypothetical protein